MGLNAREYVRRAKVAFAGTSLSPIGNGRLEWFVSDPAPRWVLRGVARDPKPSAAGGVVHVMHAMVTAPRFSTISFGPVAVPKLSLELEEGIMQLRSVLPAIAATEQEALIRCVWGPDKFAAHEGFLEHGSAAILVGDWDAAEKQLARQVELSPDRPWGVMARDLLVLVRDRDYSAAYDLLDAQAEKTAAELGIIRGNREDDPLRPR